MIDPPTDTYQHNTYYSAEYGERNLTISPVCPRERFSFISSVPRLILVKGLGHFLLLSYPVYFACLLLFCFLNQKPLNIYLSVCAAFSLSSVTYQYLLLLVGIDILIYRKATIDPLDLWVIKNRLLAWLTGKATQLNLLTSPPSRAFLAPLPGSVVLLVSEASE